MGVVMSLERQPDLDRIRKKAEEIARERPAVVPEQGMDSYKRYVHELQVHQIELEIQNEELRSAQNDLEAVRNRYADLFNNAPVGYVVLDANGFVLEINNTFSKMIGRQADGMIQKPLSGFLPEPARHIFLSRYKAFFKNPERAIELEVGKSNREKRVIKLYGSREQSTSGFSTSRERVRIAVIDITRQYAAETAMQKAHDELGIRHRIAEIMLKTDDEEMFHEVLVTLLSHFKSTYGYFGYIDEEENLVCPSMTRNIFSKCEVENKSIVFPRSAWGGIWGESLLSKKTVCKNSGLRLPTGHIQLINALAVPIVNHGNLIGQIVIGNRPEGYDQETIECLESIVAWISPVLSARLERDRQHARRIKAESDLMQAQKMESIGVLAGGIAHDFNNLLAPIIGYTDLMLEDAVEGDRNHLYMEEISKAAHRAKDLVSQLLAYSRKQLLAVKPLDVNDTIDKLSGMLKRLIREDIRVVYGLGGDTGLVRGDAGQLEQVLVNLVVNAQDAMPDGGRLFIETGRYHLLEKMRVLDFEIEAGEYCCIQIQDSGEGIPKDILPYIFDPFFTTKDMGRGTGMGLATCYGIVKQHGGYIWPESKPGGGTIFKILLPTAAAETGGPGDQVDNDIASETASNGEAVMIVEDEPGVRKMAALALKKKGYRVFETASPEACLRYIEMENPSLDMLLTDVILPGYSGKELYSRLKEKLPHLKVLYMSGYTDNVISDKGVLKAGVHFIGKPFSIRELLKKVHSVLN